MQLLSCLSNLEPCTFWLVVTPPKLQNCRYTALSCLLLWLLVTRGGRGREEIYPTMNLIASAIPYMMHVWEQFLPDLHVHLAHVLKSRI